MTTYGQTLVVGHSPSLNEICMVRDSDCWHRAACIQAGATEQAMVVLVDSGETQCKVVTDILRIPKRFVDWCPFMANLSILNELRDNLESPHNEKMRAIAAELLPPGSCVSLQIVAREADGTVYVDMPHLSTALKANGFI